MYQRLSREAAYKAAHEANLDANVVVRGRFLERELKLEFELDGTGEAQLVAVDDMVLSGKVSQP
jgi:hypothetical protein